jgi:hypothetical protein
MLFAQVSSFFQAMFGSEGHGYSRFYSIARNR